MILPNKFIAVLLIHSFIFLFVAEPATISIDESIEYQTIDGFGAFLCLKRGKAKPEGSSFFQSLPWEVTWDTMAYNLGISAVRHEISPALYPSQGSPLDPDGRVFCMETMNNVFMHFKELKKRGITRFIGTVWSPPCWMKYSKDCTKGGHMDSTYNEEYTDYIVNYCKLFRDSVGVELYAVSLQNEPVFKEPYNSCIVPPKAMRTLIEMVAPKLEAAGLSTKIYGPEHMGWAKLGTYSNLVLKEPVNKYLYAFAVHGYTDGIELNYGTSNDWEAMHKVCNPKGIKLWMTETGSKTKTYLETAEGLHKALKSGKISLWTWWAYNDNLLEDDSYTPRESFYGSKHYFRFIRPDAVMVESESAQDGLWVTAFKHKTDKKMTVVIVNNNAGTSIELSGKNIPSQFDKYETSESKRCEKIGMVSGRDAIDIAGKSITTLYGDFTPTNIEFLKQQQQINVHGNAFNKVFVYSLDGKCIRRIEMVHSEEYRSFVWDGKDALGKTVARGMYRIVYVNIHGIVVKNVPYMHMD